MLFNSREFLSELNKEISLKQLKNQQTLSKMFRKFLNPAILSIKYITNLFKLR